MDTLKKDCSYRDLNVGDIYFSPTRTITESDIYQFAGQTGDYNELHTSISFAQETRFHERIAHGMLILAIANGLFVRMGLLINSVFLGIESWQFLKPVLIGDTLQLKLTIAEKRLTKDEKRGIIGMRYEVLNQRDEVVGSGLFRRMIAAKSE